VSHGMAPVATACRIASAFALTSACDQRSNADSIARRSPSRKRGLTSASKLTVSPAAGALISPSLVSRMTRPSYKPAACNGQWLPTAHQAGGCRSCPPVREVPPPAAAAVRPLLERRVRLFSALEAHLPARLRLDVAAQSARSPPVDRAREHGLCIRLGYTPTACARSRRSRTTAVTARVHPDRPAARPDRCGSSFRAAPAASTSRMIRVLRTRLRFGTFRGGANVRLLPPNCLPPRIARICTSSVVNIAPFVRRHSARGFDRG
jgi:hypothetical protein